MEIYDGILNAKQNGIKLLAILLDPDKIAWETLGVLVQKINQSPATHILIGGSHVTSDRIDGLVQTVKSNCSLPVVLFPGNPSQISTWADGILFLSLLSGRNPDFLIGHQAKAAPILKKSNLEVIPTGYILIESGQPTAVEKVSQTTPIGRKDYQKAVATALAGQMLGKKLIYLEAGSGADLPVPIQMVSMVAEQINVPLIVGGGIRTRSGIHDAYAAGADMVVIGTAFENDMHFFD